MVSAGDLAVSVLPRHYILRTTWVVGQGRNFIDTMADVASGREARVHGRISVKFGA